MPVLSEVFYWIVNMSILAGFTGLIVAVLRKIHKIPRFAVYILWLLPLIRFWISAAVSSSKPWIEAISPPSI